MAEKRPEDRQALLDKREALNLLETTEEELAYLRAHRTIVCKSTIEVETYDAQYGRSRVFRAPVAQEEALARVDWYLAKHVRDLAATCGVEPKL